MKGIIFWIIAALVIVGVLVGVYMSSTPEPQEEIEVGDSGVNIESSGGPNQFLQEAPSELAPNNIDEATSEIVEDVVLEEDSFVTTISIDDTGFTPSDVTISAGDTVKFINNGQAPHWPASDVHPTHEVLPDFDSERGLQTGESYSYTFTEAGSWDFHDHLRPSFTGTVTVQ